MSELPKPTPSRKLMPWALGCAGLGCISLPVVFLATIAMGTGILNLSFMHRDVNELAPKLQASAAIAMPDGFQASSYVQPRGKISLTAESTGSVSTANALKAQFALIDAVESARDSGDKAAAKVDAGTRYSIDDTRISLDGYDKERFSEAAPFIDKVAPPAKQLSVSSDVPSLVVRAGYQVSEEMVLRGPCEASISSFVENIEAVEKLTGSGFEVIGDFMACNDNMPGTHFQLKQGMKPQAAKDLARLATSSGTQDIFWAKLTPKGNLYIRVKPSNPEAEQLWREQWTHGDVELFNP